MSTAHPTALVQAYSEMHGLIVGVGKHSGNSAEVQVLYGSLRANLASLQLHLPPQRRIIMAIQGLGNMSPDQLRFEIQRGAKLVRYQYCVSLLVITFKRWSEVYYIPAGESSVVKGLPWTLLTMVAGWWGIPWGPIFSIQALITNFKGGKDLTADMGAAMNRTASAPAMAATQS